MMNIRLNAAQKGALQLAENTLVAGIITGALAVLPDLSGAGPINWSHDLNIFGIAMFFAVLNAGIAVVKAWNAPLGSALGADIAAIQGHYDGSKGPVWLPPPAVSTTATLQSFTPPASLVTIHVAQPSATPATPVTPVQAPGTPAAPVLSPLPTATQSSNAAGMAGVAMQGDTMPRAAVSR